ncbi:aldo/keto reductase [Cognatishimia sp. SS12]|uniref:aldo/keto reductase n=1 Tax=Cognatishimia sp. SS12 TaxID=2979465 RepID=UPI00232CCF69|nr:aldo/keto reductase [Cognatishimia sp. SS12]MDC0739378.1 aldo/keto reductase [Cognatishimia sp. SS12]
MTESDVDRRKLDATGNKYPLFSLGSWNTWDRMTPDSAVELICRAQAEGCAFFDVAHYNMGPHSEHSQTDILFGNAWRDSGLKREEIQLCGKLWLWKYPELSFREQIETSLDRIGTDRFETIVLGDYFERLDIPRVVTAVNELIADGLVQSWGINNWVLSDTHAALDYAAQSGMIGPSFAQLKYSPVRRSMAEGAGYGSLFGSGKLALQASDCLEGGILALKTPNRKIGADPGDIRARIIAAAPEIAKVARDFDATPAQAVLAFCLANPATANVLFGVSQMAQLEENLGALSLARTHGADIRARMAPFWLDKHVPSEGQRARRRPPQADLITY